jgi:hypothetical protein
MSSTADVKLAISGSQQNSTNEVRKSALVYHNDGPRLVYMYLYIKAITCMNCVDQSFVIQFHQYFQWVPKKEEHEGYIANPRGYKPDFMPNYPPSNAREVESEHEEFKMNQPNALHILTCNSSDLWGETVKNIRDDQILFGLSRKYRVSISSPMDLHNFPFDIQSLHIYFECMNSTNEVKLLPCFAKDSCCEMELGTMASSPDFVFHEPIIEFSAFGEDQKV